MIVNDPKPGTLPDLGENLDADILVVCPTRDSPDRLQKCFESMTRTSTRSHMVAWVDNDQGHLYEHLDDPRLTIMIGKRVGPVAAANRICQVYRGRIQAYGMIPDDSAFKTKAWDQWLLRTMSTFPNHIGVVSACQSGIDYVNFPWVTREWLHEAVGWLYYPPNFHHCCDTILELLGDATHIVYAREDEFAMWHELGHTFNRGKMAEDATNFLTWAVTDRRRMIEQIRGKMYEEQHA
jgi:hypothetical protein